MLYAKDDVYAAPNLKQSFRLPRLYLARSEKSCNQHGTSKTKKRAGLNRQNGFGIDDVTFLNSRSER